MAERTARGSGLSIASAVAVAAIVFCLGRGSLLPFVGLQQDDGHYLVAARSIADGWGYRAAQAPGKPWQTKFPPVFPLSLSVGWSLSSDWPAVAHWQALETLTFGAIAAGLLCLVMVRTASLSNPLAALATVAGSTAPALLAMTAQDMSEPLFMLWIAVAIWSLNVPDDSRFAKTRGVWLALMVLTRSAGLLMCVGAIVWLWRRRALGWTVVVPVGLAVVGWFGWVQFASIGARAPVYEVSYVQWLATVGLTAWPRIVSDNLLAVPVHGGSLVCAGADDDVAHSTSSRVRFLCGSRRCGGGGLGRAIVSWRLAVASRGLCGGDRPVALATVALSGCRAAARRSARCSRRLGRDLARDARSQWC